MDSLNSVLGDVSNGLYTYVLIALLVGAGLYFTVRTRGVQARLFARMVSVIARSRGESHGGISSFQAFAIGISSRVGTGNIAGVAIALALGGPGAIFWMWVVAVVGMATAFIEATLAQMYKVRWRDGTFRGGPAFYIQRGLGSRGWGAVFAVLLIFVFGFAFEMVQANTIAATLDSGHGVPAWISAVLLVLLTAPVVFGGIRAVARVAELEPLDGAAAGGRCSRWRPWWWTRRRRCNSAKRACTLEHRQASGTANDAAADNDDAGPLGNRWWRHGRTIS